MAITHNRVATLLVFALLSATPSIAQGQTNPVVISNFKVGLVCGLNSDRRICFETHDIQLTNEGRCVYNRQLVPCTWYGYSFDYQLPTDIVKLQFESSSSVPRDVGNPTAEIEKNALVARYEMELRNDTNHFFNPQYTSVSRASLAGTVDQNTQSCSYLGEKLFEFTLQLHYPDP
ncbi:MAG: hypothetical protein EXR00_02775 [Alphaproteobacteria bacterium]|nr:hypothetical protein [Alphaproteobacteria bacterium]